MGVSISKAKMYTIVLFGTVQTVLIRGVALFQGAPLYTLNGLVSILIKRKEIH